MSNTARLNILEAVHRERHQDVRHGAIEAHGHSVAEWLLIMEAELQEAKKAWIQGNENEAMQELLQVVATGFAAMEEHGIHERKFVFVGKKA